MDDASCDQVFRGPSPDIIPVNQPEAAASTGLRTGSHRLGRCPCRLAHTLGRWPKCCTAEAVTPLAAWPCVDAPPARRRPKRCARLAASAFVCCAAHRTGPHHSIKGPANKYHVANLQIKKIHNLTNKAAAPTCAPSCCGFELAMEQFFAYANKPACRCCSNLGSTSSF